MKWDRLSVKVFARTACQLENGGRQVGVRSDRIRLAAGRDPWPSNGQRDTDVSVITALLTWMKSCFYLGTQFARASHGEMLTMLRYMISVVGRVEDVSVVQDTFGLQDPDETFDHLVHGL